MARGVCKLQSWAVVGIVALGICPPGAAQDVQLVALIKLPSLQQWERWGGHLARALRWSELPASVAQAVQNQVHIPWDALHPQRPVLLAVLANQVALEVVVALPVQEPQEVVQHLGRRWGPIQQQGPRLWKFGRESWTGVLSWQPPWLLVAQRPKAFAMWQNCSQLQPALGELSALGLVFYPDRVPEVYREMIVDHLRGFPQVKSPSGEARSSSEENFGWARAAEALLWETQKVVGELELGAEGQSELRLQLWPRPRTPLAQWVRLQSKLPAVEVPTEAGAWFLLQEHRSGPWPGGAAALWAQGLARAGAWTDQAHLLVPPLAQSALALWPKPPTPSFQQVLVQWIPLGTNQGKLCVQVHGVKPSQIQKILQALIRHWEIEALSFPDKEPAPAQALSRRLFPAPSVWKPWLGPQVELSYQKLSQGFVLCLAPWGKSGRSLAERVQKLPSGTVICLGMRTAPVLRRLAARESGSAQVILQALTGLLAQGKDRIVLTLRCKQESVELSLRFEPQVVRAGVMLALWALGSGS